MSVILLATYGDEMSKYGEAMERVLITPFTALWLVSAAYSLDTLSERPLIRPDNLGVFSKVG